MEIQHSETVVDRAVAYVKDALGIRPAHPDDPQVDTKDDMLLNPGAYTMKSIGELNSETPLSSDRVLERAEDDTESLLDPEDAMLMRAVETL